MFLNYLGDKFSKNGKVCFQSLIDKLFIGARYVNVHHLPRLRISHWYLINKGCFCCVFPNINIMVLFVLYLIEAA